MHKNLIIFIVRNNNYIFTRDMMLLSQFYTWAVAFLLSSNGLVNFATYCTSHLCPTAICQSRIAGAHLFPFLSPFSSSFLSLPCSFCSLLCLQSVSLGFSRGIFSAKRSLGNVRPSAMPPFSPPWSPPSRKFDARRGLPFKRFCLSRRRLNRSLAFEVSDAPPPNWRGVPFGMGNGTWLDFFLGFGWSKGFSLVLGARALVVLSPAGSLLKGHPRIGNPSGGGTARLGLVVTRDRNVD